MMHTNIQKHKISDIDLAADVIYQKKRFVNFYKSSSANSLRIHSQNEKQD